ncbi:MAG: inorganic phosphate transporter, partial [Actinobacteria bacterium]|nr:inorganic phosphate transporter [Actinomycetota bacterium]
MNAQTGLARMVHEVRELDLGERTSYSSGRLTVGEESARDLLRDPALAEVRLACTRPDDSLRIVGVLDAVQPCSKGPGGGGVFPGLLGPAMPVGRGETHVLRGAAVLAAGYLPRAQEAIIDMSGPAAPLSPLAAIGLLLAALVLVPPLFGTAVATTVATSLVGTVEQDGSTPQLAFLVAVLTAVLVVAALARLGLPTSLTLALIGGITGAGLGLGLPVAWQAVGVVLLIGLAAPLVGGFVAWLLIRLLRHAPIGGHASRLGWAHRTAFGAQCLAYAANDGQKALAILAVAAGTVGPPVAPRLEQLSLIALFFGIGLLVGLPRIAATV